MLCSWDAEEFGLMGSWEWVEVYTLKCSYTSNGGVNTGRCGGVTLLQQIEHRSLQDN